MITHRKAFICGGDFYANSTLLGSRREDIRIDRLTEHLVIHYLAIANLHNTDTTFRKLYSEGSVRLAISHTNQLKNTTKIFCWFTSDAFSGFIHLLHISHNTIHYTVSVDD